MCATQVSTVSNVPLCVDLDGTLILSDLLLETFLSAAKQNPGILFSCIGWVLRGRSILKTELASRAVVNFATLPYNEPLLKYLRREKEAGRMLVLATASDFRLADGVASHVGLFDEVIGSDSNVNLKGHAKRERLQNAFPEGYDYIGNSSQDFPLWECAKRRMVANAPRSVIKRLESMGPVEHVFARTQKTSDFTRAIRMHQWTKNLLIFIPLATSHKVTEQTCLLPTIGAFIVFSLTASSVYLLNDLLDI